MPLTSAPADLQTFEGQHPKGPRHGRFTFTMRWGLVEIYRHIQRFDLILAAKLVPVTLNDPDATILDWKDYSARGFPNNFLIVKRFDFDLVTVQGVPIAIPKNEKLFGIHCVQNGRIFEYDWMSESPESGLPIGHDDKTCSGGPIWRRT